MNINFGLFPEPEPGSIVSTVDGKRLKGKDKTVAKRKAIAARALVDCRAWLEAAG
jgi:methylenetetrahydrofolate--tRNA-(uracil-5-)-methyltransferase